MTSRLTGSRFSFFSVFPGPFLDLLLHFLTGLESYDEFFADFNFLAGSWVSGGSCGTAFDFKYAEIPQFNATGFHEDIRDCVEGFLNNRLRQKLSLAELLRNDSNDVFFGFFRHARFLL